MRPLRIAPLALVALTMLGLACRGHYREIATSSLPGRVSRDQVAFAGVRAEPSGRIEVEASARLAAATGIDLPDVELAPEAFELLLGDPALLFVERTARDQLRHRLERRYVLVGDVQACPVEERSRWDISVPIPVWTPITLTMTLWTLPITYDRQRDVPHAAVVLRLVDLESGRVESEFFAIANVPPGEAGLSPNIARAGLRALGIGSTR